MRNTITVILLASAISTRPQPRIPKHTLTNSNPKPPPPNHSKPQQVPPPSSSSTSSQSNRPPLLLSTVRLDKHRPSQNRITYYAELASKLAEDARFDDFFMIVETVTSSGGLNSVEFSALLNSELVCKGILSVIESDDGLRKVIGVLTGFQKLRFGSSSLEVFLSDQAVIDSIRREFKRILKCGGVEEVIDLMEMMSGIIS